MAALAFDTLDASKTLRNAGVDERVAEAIVQIVQRTTEMPDISHLATKDDLERSVAATKDDLERAITPLATKAELAVVRSELAALRGDMALMRAELEASQQRMLQQFSEKMRDQGWRLLGGVGVLLAISMALTKALH